MGQRSQLFVILPELYYNERNVNNKPKRIKVYHNQWLYGMNFIKYLARLLKAIKYLNEEENKLEKRDLTQNYEKSVENAILHSNSFDLDYITNTHLYDDSNENDNSLLLEKDIKDFIKYWDNNNGFMCVVIDKKGNSSYCILNGTGEADEIKIRTPLEYFRLFYVRLFYTEEEFKTVGEYKSTLRAIKDIEKFKAVDIFDELKKLKKHISEYNKKEVLDKLKQMPLKEN